MLDGDRGHDNEDNVRVNGNENISSSYVKGSNLVVNLNGWGCLDLKDTKRVTLWESGWNTK